MKKFLLLAVSLSFIVAASGQYTQGQAYSKDYYLQKSKNQENTGWILLGFGTATLAAGGVMAITTGNADLAHTSSPGYKSSDAYIYVLAAGAALDISSIPFFISASKNRKLAAQLSISNQNIYLLQQNTVTVRYAPALTIKICL